ncbi:hypothetical protein G7054_g5764 [Neopestalotiopsis clavispora]|nr:hypothetical protein G7054_g5764 [Neopestalotiopsis clavispora]
MHLFDPRVSPLDSLLDLVALLAPQPPRPHAHVLAAQLGLHGPARQLVHQALSDTHGDLGLRRARGGEESRVGRRAEQCRGSQDPARLWLSRRLAAGGRWSWLEGVDGVGESGVAADGRALLAAVLYIRDWASSLAVG